MSNPITTGTIKERRMELNGIVCLSREQFIGSMAHSEE